MTPDSRDDCSHCAVVFAGLAVLFAIAVIGRLIWRLT